MTKLDTSDFNQLYNIIEAVRTQLYPFRMNLIGAKNILNNPLNPFSYTPQGNFTRAILELSERATRKYQKPEFNIDESVIDGKTYNVELEIIDKAPFCNLVHFVKQGFNKNLPKILVVSPLAGHHATLLKNTVKDLLPFFDVYITDWIDASQVPTIYGKFDMDDFIDYIIQFIKDIPNPLHVMAVCQPTVPVLAATAIMSNQEDLKRKLPKSLILIGGPVDARENPTAVNKFATSKSIAWFKQNTIMSVPNNYPGAGRKVYPGFLQLMGFMSMNWERHLKSHLELFENIAEGCTKKVEIHKKFYDEYLAVMDLPAEYYIQTIDEVFLKYSLAKGELISRGRNANLETIKKTAILGIEGEKDDIAAVGQTLSALNLCKNLSKSKKHYYLQKGVGHYGVFSGSKFRKFVMPVIKDFAYKYNDN